MNRALKYIARSSIALFVFGTVACSNQYSSSSPQVDETTLMNNYSTMSTGVSNFLSANIVTALNNDNNTEIYYAQSDQTRPAESLISLLDMGVFTSSASSSSSDWSGMSADDVTLQYGLQNAQVFFLDGFVNDGTQDNDPREFVLELTVQDGSGNTYYFAVQSSEGSYSFSNTQFDVDMTTADGSEQLHLTSYDINKQYSEELSNTVTFYVSDGSGSLGQITALHLYQ